MKRYSLVKKIGALGATAVCALALAACGGNAGGSNAATGSAAGSAKASGTVYKIGVIQTIEHKALDQSREGFEQALKDAGIKYELDYQNAQGDQSANQTIATKFANDGKDLVLAIGTQAAQASSSATADIPIVGTAITDFEGSGLVKSNDAPGGNVTGASDLTPVDDQIELLHKLLPDAKKVGILYCSAESNSEIQVKMAKKALDKLGIEVVEKSVSSSNEIQQAVESLASEKVDAIYAPTDNTIAAAMPTVSQVATEHKIPTVVGCDTMVEDGGLVSYSINYKDLGYKAGEMAVKILKGEAKPADMPIEYLDKTGSSLIKNEKLAKELGIDLSVLDN